MRSTTRNVLILKCLVVLLLNACSTSQSIQSVKDPTFQSKIGKGDYVSVKFHRQVNAVSCGAAVLASLFDYWQVSMRQREILQRYPPASKIGYTLGELKSIANTKNLKAFSFSGSIGQLRAQIRKGRPSVVLLHVNAKYIGRSTQFANILSGTNAKEYSHFVIVVGINRQTLWLLDPVLGLKSVKRKFFLKLWQKSQNATLLLAR